jgi:hypothetical protein
MLGHEINVALTTFCDVFPRLGGSSGKPVSKSKEHPSFTDFLDPCDGSTPIQKATLQLFKIRLETQFAILLLSLNPDASPAALPSSSTSSVVIIRV